MAGDSFLSKPPVFTGKNYHAWSVKMETYLEAHGLWEMLEIDEVPALPEDPTIAQMREYREEKKKMNKAKTCIHSALTDEVFTKIMTCKTAKQAWVLLKNEYEGNDRTKRMQVLNLKREFEMQKMKERESLKDYSERLKKVVNKIRLLGEELPDDRVVEKILVTLPERFESKISSLEESRDLSEISLADLLHALEAQEQRRTYRNESNIEGAFEANEVSQIQPKGKNQQQPWKKKGSQNGANRGKFPPCQHCKKTSRLKNIVGLDLM
ncbi:uncharacterized protein LOC116029757 [Ipomoea triloba]|uniref:uncharacterized protein LOC116029757 n=1 Tax=Ipomoea triloba TaxID=35885 RepID=UPI00125DBED4|nr:uncharacterized protein LOC116029757 [Ipomoea triloba]